MVQVSLICAKVLNGFGSSLSHDGLFKKYRTFLRADPLFDVFFMRIYAQAKTEQLSLLMTGGGCSSYRATTTWSTA